MADALNIKEVAFVEKDYYAVQLLKLINELEIPDFKLIFSGGTCLSKAYKNTQRMSEDIDIKFAAQLPDRTRAHRKELRKLIIDTIQCSKFFSVNKKQANDQYCTQAFEIEYPNNFQHPALKTALKLELVQSILYDPINNRPIHSIYNE